ncbi:Uncharacterised protein [uncultured archaeon]|nr:Uncharacterised protein [uncultured archaeon]
MTKKFKAAKTSIVAGIVLVSVIIAIFPTASAGLLFNLQGVVTVSWEGGAAQKPVIPRGELRVLSLNITYYVTKGLFGAGLLAAYNGKQIVITIEITETPSWCTANIAQGTIAAQVIPNGQFHASTTLTLQVADDAPAYGLGSIKVKATAAAGGLIQGYQNDFTLSFIPDYKPLIKPTLPQTNSKEIGPMDTATFPILIENLGNARTVVLLNVVNVSNGWNAVVTSQVTLEEGSGSTATAYLVIRPPKGFGYHYDEKTIMISMQPVKADNFNQKGEITYETFLVQSRGFSTPGFEAITFIGALAIVFIIMACIRKTKK